MDDKHILFCIAGFLFFIAMIVFATTYNNHIDDEAIVRLVEHGADPLHARCAVRRCD